MRQKVHELLKDSALQAIFIYGEPINTDLYNSLTELCQEKQIFISNIYFNDETGCVLAVNDYNQFAKEILQDGESSVVRPDCKKFNLFSKLHKNTFKNWKQPTSVQTPEGFQEKGEVVLNAAKNIYISHVENSSELMLKHPLYPTIFNKFFKGEDQKNYLEYYFTPK
jgi:hypothetical protein